jgi:capsular polysaccharide biosynthesis protein
MTNEPGARKPTWGDVWHTLNELAQKRTNGQDDHNGGVLTKTNGDGAHEVLVLREAPYLHASRPVAVLPVRTVVHLVLQALLVILVCATLSAGFAMSRPRIHGAQIDVIYAPSTSASSSVQLDRELATQQVIVQSRSVLAPVAAKAHVGVDALEKAISVEVLPGTEVLRVTAADRHAARARVLAQDVADSYIALDTGAKSKTLQGTPRILASAHVLSTPLFPRPARAAGIGALLGLFIAAGMTLLLLRRHED